MQRNLVADRPTAIRAPSAPRQQESDFTAFIHYMVEQMAKRFRNQVFGGMTKGTIDKFEDAQPGGNYARIYLTLAKRSTASLRKQFSDRRIEKWVAQICAKVDNRNKQQLYDAVEQRMGLSTTELSNTEGLTYDINALVLQTAQWVKQMRDETLQAFTNNSLMAMSQGKSLTHVMAQFDDLVQTRKNHAKMVSRCQIANFNSMATKMRAQNLGITQAVWLGNNDGRERASHIWRNGKTFDLNKGLYCPIDQKHLLPGVDYQCRCTYHLIVPGVDDAAKS